MTGTIKIKSVRYVPAKDEAERMKKILKLLLSFDSKKQVKKDVSNIDQGRDR